MEDTSQAETFLNYYQQWGISITDLHKKANYRCDIFWKKNESSNIRAHYYFFDDYSILKISREIYTDAIFIEVSKKTASLKAYQLVTRALQDLDSPVFKEFYGDLFELRIRGK